MKRQKSLEEELYQIGLLFLVIAVVVMPFLGLFVLPELASAPSGCVFWLLFDAYCPGCGGTRAVDALLHGHFLQSLWYHPLVLYTAALYLIFMVSWTLAKAGLFGVKRGLVFRPGYLYGMLVVLAVNFIVNNLLKFCFVIVMI